MKYGEDLMQSIYGLISLKQFLINPMHQCLINSIYVNQLHPDQ